MELNLEAIFINGKNAGKLGRKKTNCPHSEANLLHRVTWLYGWEQGRVKREKTNGLISIFLWFSAAVILFIVLR